MTDRRSFLTLVLGAGTVLAYDALASPLPTDETALDTLAQRSRALRIAATETIDPLLLERHCLLLCELLDNVAGDIWWHVGRFAAESAWLAANAHSDSGDDQASLRWGGVAARLARRVGDHDLRAHALSRVCRSYLSLGEASLALQAIERVDLASLSPFGRVRVEVHRALAVARLPGEPHGHRTSSALEALGAAHEALASAPPHARPEWVWWTDDGGFLRTWEAEVLRSLEMPELAVPAFHAALATAATEDVREMPFLQAGLAQVVAQAGDLAAAADEAIRAVVLARAIGAEAALSRVRAVHRVINDRAPASRHARSLREALRS